MRTQPAIQRPHAMPHDDSLPGLDVLLDPSRIGGLLEPHLLPGVTLLGAPRATHVRYKQATSALVAYAAEVRLPDGDEPHPWIFYGKSYTPEHFAMNAGKRASRRWCDSPIIDPVVAVPDAALMFYAFPNDCGLTGLRLFATHRRVRRALYESFPEFPRAVWRISEKWLAVEVVRYKPEKRAVVRVTTRAARRAGGDERSLCAYIKTYTQRHGEMIAARFPAQHDRVPPGGPAVPRIRSIACDGRALVLESLAGSDLRAVLQQPHAERVFADVGAALAALHHTPCERWPHGGPAAARRSLAATARALAATRSDAGLEFARAYTRLQVAPPDESGGAALLHGDFHPGQVLVRADGLGFLDFDRAHRGDPCADVGNFLAHLHPAAPELPPGASPAWTAAFVAAYERAAGSCLDPNRLRFWTALGLLQLAGRPFRNLEFDWRTTTARLARASAEVLA